MKSTKRAFLSLFLVVTTIVWLGFFAIAGNAIASSPNPEYGIYIAQAVQAGEKLVKGEEKKIGDGTVRTWVKLGTDNKPVSIGVTMTESGLTGLPDDVDTGREKGQESTKLKLLDQIGHYTFENELKFPPEAAPYVHMGFNWNPYGHWPQQVFTEPHYDVHFYMETPEYRHEIGKGNYKDILKGHKKLPPELVPKGYEIAYGTLEPRMGIHWANFSSPELQPGKFNKIFLFGSFNGRMLFWEPMITQKFLQKKIADYSEVISQPAAYPKSGYYPMTYSIKYDQERKEFDISLDDLVYRESTEVASNVK
jgi:Domain of unknown function (DUF5602)